MHTLPFEFIVFVTFLLGLIIGSFLDVIVCRFHTGASLNGRSRCLSCGHTLSWYELFPLLSFLALRGKCLLCKARISPRLLYTEILTALLFVYVGVNASSFFELAFGLVLTSILIVTLLYDYNHMIIPNVFVWVVGILASLHLGVTLYDTRNIEVLYLHVLSAVGAFLFYAGLWFFSKGRWIGFGDAKLAFSLGLFLTPLAAFSMIVFSFWIGAVISLLLLAFQYFLRRGKRSLPFSGSSLTMKSEVPFAPFMICAFAIVYFGHVQIFSLISLLL